MKIPIRFVQLHESLFLGGKNHQLKVTANPELSLTYDRDNKELHVVYKGQATIMPVQAVNSMEPIDPIKADITMTAYPVITAPPPPPAKPIKAQASAPNGIKI